MKRLMLLTLSAVLVASPGLAKHHKAAAKPAAAAKAPAELKWGPAPPALPGGAEIAVVKGDPMKAGPFTIHLKMPANYSVPPHWHPFDEKVTAQPGEISAFPSGISRGEDGRLDLPGQAISQSGAERVRRPESQQQRRYGADPGDRSGNPVRGVDHAEDPVRGRRHRLPIAQRL